MDNCSQLAFTSDGNWVACGRPHRHLRLQAVARECLSEVFPSTFAGGVTAAPDGKMLVATSTDGGKLLRWGLPVLRSITGFDFWPPFSRLTFSPNGEFLAGISLSGFEVRFGRTGGIDYRHRMPRGRRVPGDPEPPTGFVSFDRHSTACAFGWADEFHVLDTSTGSSRLGPRVEAQFRDAAFLPSGQHFATVGDDGFLKLWNPETWKVAREYDWNCGPLTALAFSADGSGGVCGTADGKLVQFDVDE